MQNIQEPYKLRCTLPGHSKDVRCVAVGDFSFGSAIVSGSRDKTAKLWIPEGYGFVSNHSYSGHEGYVSAIAVASSSGNDFAGSVVTGCQDGKIRIFEPMFPNPVETLVGHSDTVCTIVVKSGYILSGSWDKTARVWSGSSTLLTLTGHSAAVWAIEVLDISTRANEITSITGSADKTIKMWKGNSTIQVFTGHTDCVRALAICGPDRFLSAANDASVRLWITSGECLATFYGHTNYIYGLAMMPSGTSFVSCGEDRSLRIWKLDCPEECQQTVYLPAQSVWTVAVMENNDIVTGSSDGLVRVFTQDPGRAAEPTVQKLYEDELATTSLSAQQELGGVKVADLPGPESLFEAGKREGQTKIVRNGDVISCYSWSSADGQWSKVGDVMGAAGNSSANMYNGREYDYVFSIDIAEGQPPLKLPYNVSEDPWSVAQKFIHQNDLSQYHLDTVANFIIKNSQDKRLGSAPAQQPPAGSFVDPLTGGSRYVPSSSNSSVGQSFGADPFTGSGRYVPAADSSVAAQHSYFPVREFLRFDQSNLDAIKRKLMEFNGQVNPSCQLPAADLQKFVQCATTVSGNLDGMAGLLDTLFRWPSDVLFPMLDILRLASRYAPAYRLLIDGGKYLEMLLGVLHTSVPNCMLICRIMSHMILHHQVDAGIATYGEAILDAVVSVVASSSPESSKHAQWKNVQIAVSTVILNMAVLMYKCPAPVEAAPSLLTAIRTVVPKLQDEEALFRVLAAAGTVLKDDASIAVARSLGLRESIEHLGNVSGKVGECVKHVLTVL